MYKRLKQLRKALNLKQREFAGRLNVQTGLIGTWEAGQRSIPKVRIYQICQEFNVNREWFETGIGDMFLPDPKQITEEQVQEKFMIDIFSRLTPKQQNIILNALKSFLESSCE